MPAATTHVEFAKDVYGKLPKGNKQKITNYPMFFLGSQGPDLFFFSKYAFLPGSLRSLGNRMHQENVKEMIEAMKEYVTGKPSLESYYYGYLCHYALDATCHPIIISYAKQQARKTHRPESEFHFALEAEIDLYTLDKKMRSPKDYQVYQEVAVSKNDATQLAQMYQTLFLEVFEEYVSLKQILEAIQGITRLTSWLKPNSIWKYELVSKVEDRFKAPKLVSGMMLVGKGGKPLPILNEDHQVYTYGDHNQFQDSHSFEELYQIAYDYAISLITDYQPTKIQTDFNGNK